MDDRKNKTILDLFSNYNKGVKTRIFTFYYYLMKKATFNVIIYCIFMFFETVQILSYAFSDPVTLNN